MLPWKLRKRQILTFKQNLSSVYFSLAKFQFVNCNLSFAMIWQMTYTHKLPTLCPCTATLRGSLPKTGPLRFGSENRFPLNFAHEYILVQK